MKNVALMIRKLGREIKKNYPGVSEETVAEAVKALFVVVADSGIGTKAEDTDSDAWDLFNSEVSTKASEDESSWAAEMVKARTENMIRPFYDKAVAGGVDPVPVLQAMCGMSEQAACDAVNALSSEKTAQIPAPATDPFATNEEQKDEEHEEQYA
jgi:hypothetical protein